PDRFLKDDVVFLRLGDLPDGAVGALDHARQLVVAARVEVLPEFALLALEFAIEIVELALALLPVGLRHGHRVLLEVLLHFLELLGRLGELLVAPRELLLYLLLRALRDRRVAQDPVETDETDLRLGESGTRGC